jgi:hypothetical protein
MNINNLQFFDKFGKNLNLDYNVDNEHWVGTIYFPELSTFLFDNENIFILEKIGQDFKFPAISAGQSILFEWNDNEIEEFFLYDVERDNQLKNFFINKKDSQLIKYEDVSPISGPATVDINLPLQVNIAFNPNLEIRYERTLFIYLIDESSPATRTKVAEINLYGEGLEEDERFGVWARNFGIKFNKEDANILKDYDIKEALPDWEKVNESRKALLVNKDQIYPYIGTYKGLSNFVNLLGYKDVLQIKEYWKNVNPGSSYFNKQLLVDVTDYLDDGKIDNMNILDKNRNIKFGNQFKKTEFLALVYQFTKETDQFDDDGIPEIEETTEFTVDEIFYKLNRLKDKLKNEFLPINVKIKDVIGEFIYFQKITIKFWQDDTKIYDFNMNEEADLSVYPDLNTNLILRSLSPLLRKEIPNGPNFGSFILNPGTENPFQNSQRYSVGAIPIINTYIKNFYDEIKNQRYPDLSARLEWEDGDDPERLIGAPIILNVVTDKFTFQSFRGVTFQDLAAVNPYFTLENIDFKNFYEITWRITKNSPNPYNFSYRGLIKDLKELPHFLPYAGTYRVTLELHDFYGNTSVFSKFVTVQQNQVPQIIGITRLEDKFDYSISNLENVRLIDFGASTLYYPKVNVLNSEDAATTINVYKNLLEWNSFYKNRYGMGQNLYDVELYDNSTQSYVPYNDPIQDHPKKEYWGLGNNRAHLRVEDFKDVSLKSLYFLRFCNTVYTDDFNAGFYLNNPKEGKVIQISLFSNYIIPYFTDLDDLASILNSSEHPGIRLFEYVVLDKIIHARARYLSKEMYHILFSESTPSPGVSSPTSGSSDTDKYTFFLPNDVYSERLIDHFKSISPVFDVETLFLFSKTKDLLTGAVQDPQFWVDQKYWRFKNDQQIGHLPSLIDQNSFNITDVKIFQDSFNIPENGIIFFTVNNLDGKSEFIWTLTNNITGEEIVRTRSVPFFVWKFKDLGTFDLKVDVFDNRNTQYSNQISKMINVLEKNQYIHSIETKLNRRKNRLLNNLNDL